MYIHIYTSLCIFETSKSITYYMSHVHLISTSYINLNEYHVGSLFQIPCEKVLRYPKLSPKALAEGDWSIRACSFFARVFF